MSNRSRAILAVFCDIFVVKVKDGLYIGTSGWSYPAGEGTWEGYFYPPGVKTELEYYSQFFNTVEVNSSFIARPSPP
jgi:uncharacterized protein YecE (DUF72 family)